MAGQITIDVYSHFIKVQQNSPLGKTALMDYCRTLADYEWVKIDGRQQRVMKAVYAEAGADRQTFRFHLHCYTDLIRHLSVYGFKDADIVMTLQPVPDPVPAALNMHTHLIARDYQDPIIEYMTKPGHVKMVTLQTGKGKTFCALRTAANIGERTMLVIKGMYVEKWTKDVLDAYDIDKSDIIVIRGSKALRDVIDYAKAGLLDCKFIICTNKTLYNYIDFYKQFGTAMPSYGCEPEELFELLGVGVRMIDEVHQDFHFNFRLDLYTNVRKTINLSATLENNSPFMNRMYEIMFPLSMRAPMPEYDKYIAVKALYYGLRAPKRLRWQMRGRKSYSHITFEQSILKQPDILKNYLSLIADVLLESYSCLREEGQKALIFAASVDMCTVITEYLKKLFGHLNIMRYTAEDDFEVLSSADVIVSTLKSAGTAFDIDGLRTCIMTNASGSMQENIQALGRLRKLKNWPDVTPEFLYFVCQDISKHIDYHKQKVEMFRDKVASQKVYYLPNKI